MQYFTDELKIKYDKILNYLKNIFFFKSFLESELNEFSKFVVEIPILKNQKIV
jgi:hypothetical protein